VKVQIRCQFRIKFHQSAGTAALWIPPHLLPQRYSEHPVPKVTQAEEPFFGAYAELRQLCLENRG
jgi:hypothetical protein